MDWKSKSEAPDAWHMTDDLHVEQGKGDPFAAAIRATRMSMLVTDPRRPDNPIVFVNEAFLRLTGYRREEIMGRNCRFLQGPDTDADAVDRLRSAIREQRDINVDILNYRKDGSTFWNALFISPVKNEAGELLYYFASQLDVTERKDSEHRIRAEKDRFELAVRERTAQLEHALETKTALLHEVDHRVKNNLQMVSSLILMQSRTIPDPAIQESLRAMLERVEALSTVHRRLYQSDDVTRFNIADFVRDLLQDLIEAFGSDNLRLQLDLEPIEIRADRAAPMALMINELATNALKHAFNGDGREHRLAARIGQPDGRLLIEISDNGSGMNGAAPSGSSFGMRLVKALSKQLDATISWSDAGPGTRVKIDMPGESEAFRHNHG
jgi:PAS domain S-box-containing protein